jgi:DNA-binding NarL/FixJ family response regulator
MAGDSSLILALEELAGHSRTPSRSAARHEALAAVAAELEGLPEEQRQALRLRYMEGLPVLEIARRMQRSEGAIQQLCHRALRNLRDRLGASAQYFSRHTARWVSSTMRSAPSRRRARSTPGSVRPPARGPPRRQAIPK